MTAPADLPMEMARLAAELGPALVPAGHDELLRSITETARSMFEAAACSLALLDEGGEELVFHVASGAGADEVVGVRVPVGQGIAGWVLASGQPIVIGETTSDPRFARDVAASTGYVPTSILAMPLDTDREAIGVIEVLDPASGTARQQQDMALLALFARQAALAIEASRVFSDLGRALFSAAALATDDGDLSRALEEVAQGAPSPSAELADVAARFGDLLQLGPDERRVAVRILGEFLAYARRLRRLP